MLVKRFSTSPVTRSLGSQRFIHSTASRYGFMDWFKLKKEAEKAKPKATKELIKEVEEGKYKSPDDLTKLKNIEFIGRKVDPIESLPVEERLNGFKIEKWLNEEKILDSETFTKLLVEEYESLTAKKVEKLSDIDLHDLSLRFNYTLQVQLKSGLLFPDHILNSSYNGQRLYDFFKAKVESGILFKKNPDIKDIEEFKFNSKNIYIQKPITSKQRKQKLKQIVKDIKTHQGQTTEKLLAEAEKL